METQNKVTTAPILLTGGTGTLGKLVAPRLTAAGYDVRVLTRRTRETEAGIEYVTGDLATGDGVQAAVDGTEIVVNLAGSQKGDDVKARHLVQAAARAGTRHLVHISVVGADRIPVVSGVDRAMFGYFAAKGSAERIVADSGVPWTTLRATQFHQLMIQAAQGMAKLPVLPVPAGFSFQPVDAGDVADRLVELALGAPAGLVPDIGGPRVFLMKDLLRAYLQSRGKHRAMLPVHVPGKAAAAFRDGANLALDGTLGVRTWEQFLADEAGVAEPTRTVAA